MEDEVNREALDQALGALWRTPRLVEDFERLCAFGGRLAGTESERAARQYVAERMRGLGGHFSTQPFDITAQLPSGARLSVDGRSSPLECTGLPGSPAADLQAIPLLDLGLGSEADFAAAAPRIRGAAVLVRHEYPFTTGHFHRRKKYDLAVAQGAAAFLIANPLAATGPVAGGCGTHGAIPALGVSHEAERVLRQAALRGEKIQLSVQSVERSWQTENLILDIPGTVPGTILVGAHLDGHAIAQSAMDNATGVAASLAIAQGYGSRLAARGRSLRLVIFNAEELGLEGSRRYVQALQAAAEQDVPELAIILDSITGFPRCSALVGASPALEQFVGRLGRETGAWLDVVRPILRNSDHFPFQDANLAAMRLIAGYGEQASLTRFLLTGADTAAMVEPAELKAATLMAAHVVYAACLGWR